MRSPREIIDGHLTEPLEYLRDELVDRFEVCHISIEYDEDGFGATVHIGVGIGNQ